MGRHNPYVLLLRPHVNRSAKLSLSPGPLERHDFDVQMFAREDALGTDGGGAFMRKAVWDLEKGHH